MRFPSYLVLLLTIVFCEVDVMRHRCLPVLAELTKVMSNLSHVEIPEIHAQHHNNLESYELRIYNIIHIYNHA